MQDIEKQYITKTEDCVLETKIEIEEHNDYDRYSKFGTMDGFQGSEDRINHIKTEAVYADVNTVVDNLKEEFSAEIVNEELHIKEEVDEDM